MSSQLDWRNSDQYPDPRKTRMKRWAWEFLRRNSNYRRDYQKYQRLPPYLRDFYLGRPELPDGVDHAIDSDLFDCRPPPLPNETFKQYLAREPTGQINLPIGHVSEKYGFECPPAYAPPPDPHDPNADVTFMLDMWPGMHARGIDIAENGGDFGLSRMDLPEPFLDWAVPEPFKPQEIVVIFDLDLDLGFQIHRVAANLKALQEQLRRKGVVKPVRRNKQEYRRYLQLLDARESGASMREMGEHFHPNIPNKYPEYHRNKRIQNHLMAAKQIRDGGYRFLVTRSHKER